MIPRRVSMEGLRAFESAARLKSFTLAGNELGLTQGAISQRIKALEASMGTTLFQRLVRSVALTPDGQQLHQALSGSFAQVAAAIELIEKQRDKTPIRLAVSPSVASCWLMPRLDKLRGLRPDMAVDILADDRFNEIGTEADIALRFGVGRYPGLRSVKIAVDEIFPVCSPAFYAANPGAASFGDRATASAWQSLPRLVDSFAGAVQSGCGWSEWADAVGVELAEPASTVNFSHAYLAIEAAARGMGVCIARRLLVANLIATGALVRVGPMDVVETRFRYYTVTAGPPSGRLKIVNQWLKQTIAETMSAPTSLPLPGRAASP